MHLSLHCSRFSTTQNDTGAELSETMLTLLSSSFNAIPNFLFADRILKHYLKPFFFFHRNRNIISCILFFIKQTTEYQITNGLLAVITKYVTFFFYYFLFEMKKKKCCQFFGTIENATKRKMEYLDKGIPTDNFLPDAFI